MPKTLRSFYATDLQWHILTILGNGNASRAIQEFADEYARKRGFVRSQRVGDNINLYEKGGTNVTVVFVGKVEVPPKRKTKKGKK